MQFKLPTGFPPKGVVNLNGISISAWKRIELSLDPAVKMYNNSIIVDTSNKSQKEINEWVTFHSFILSDFLLLDWYESSSFGVHELKVVSEINHSLFDYTNISDEIFFPKKFHANVDYSDLYSTFCEQEDTKKELVVSYLNTQGSERFSSPRTIRNKSFIRIFQLYSLIESVIGQNNEKCEIVTNCDAHGRFSHNMLSSREWCKYRLSEIINDSKLVDSYLSVIFEVREEVRHKFAHDVIIPQSHFIMQESKHIEWNWDATKENWNSDAVALLALELSIRNIAKSLILNKVFKLNFFPTLPILSTTRL